ncbi:MAG: recombination protein O N-terminal domain-containing protein, partial [Patescibacteria group bacterium]
EAVVLDKEPAGEQDARVHFFTKELGKVSAKAVSVRKIISKLNSHLEPLNLVQIRLINKNKFQVADALKASSLPADCLPVLRLIKEVFPEEQPDLALWGLVINNELTPAAVLKVAGFDSAHASCQLCQSRASLKFLVKNLDYFCSNCLSFGSNSPQNDTVIV